MPSPSLYALNQCALYKLGSKARLAMLLGVSVNQLLTLASSGDNYCVFLLPKSTCPYTNKIRKERWVQEPKRTLRAIHERIRKLLDKVTPPDFAHGAVKGRSYCSNAMAHKDAHCIATFDIRRFYPSTLKSHAFNFFRDQLLCAPDVSALLAALTCYRESLPIIRFLGLPTGSPLSPILALYANKPLFDKLNQLATDHELKFTCYFDDLTFSGDALPLGLTRLVTIALEQHGHKLAEEKTRIFRRHQRKHVTGLVIYKNKLHVPHSRFLKVRGLLLEIETEPNGAHKILLAQKLAGVLGEAAFVDKRFTGWADESQEYLKLVKNDC